MPVFDFSNIQEMQALPDGFYNCIVTEYKFIARSKSSGQPNVRLVLTVQDDEYKDRKLFKNYSLQPQALWAYKQGMINCGVDPDTFEGQVDIEEIGATVMGSECVVQVSTKPYNGRITNNVDKILPLGYEPDSKDDEF